MKRLHDYAMVVELYNARSLWALDVSDYNKGYMGCNETDLF